MSNKTMLIKRDKIVRKDKDVAKIMNSYITNITKTLNIKSSKNSNSNDIMELISRFNDHVSIKTNNRKLSAI